MSVFPDKRDDSLLIDQPIHRPFFMSGHHAKAFQKYQFNFSGIF